MASDERLIFRRSNPAATDALYGILVACSAWPRGRGSDQWQPPYPRALVEHDLVAGAVHLFPTPDFEALVLGTVTVINRPATYHPSGSPCRAPLPGRRSASAGPDGFGPTRRGPELPPSGLTDRRRVRGWPLPTALPASATLRKE